jgi:hypothetical protein
MMGSAGMTDKVAEQEAWPAGAVGLSVLGTVLGLSYYALLDIQGPRWTEDPLRLGAAAFVAAFGIAFAFTLERIRPLWSALFALVAGLVVASVFFWNGSPNGWAAGDEWHLISALLVVAVAAPLFMAARDRGRFSTEAEPIHAHAWTSLVLWAAAWAFVLASFLMLLLLAELFSLIGLIRLRELMRHEYFIYPMIGAALGGGVGLLRDRAKLLSTLQRVATTVLSVLAPVLAAGLVLFVIALPFTGLQPLWDKTSATTPILLLSVAAAMFLANAVIGNNAEEEARSRALRLAAIGLSAVLTPLGIVAAISTWLRIDQHGFTPERLWSLVFVLTVLAVALAYLWSLVSGRRAWAGRIRAANVRLAIFICALALLLSTPLADFGGISTRNQLARLTSGEVSPERFDWAALRFDFGPEGRRALDRLAASGSPQVRQFAQRALQATERYRLAEQDRTDRRTAELNATIRTVPAGAAVPEALREAIASQIGCSIGECILFWRPGEARAVAVGFTSATSPAHVALIQLQNGRWSAAGPLTDVTQPRLDDRNAIEAQQRAVAAGRVEIRPVTRRQVHVDGRPVGGVFE